MNRQKLILSTALGAVLTVGLLVGLSLSHPSAMAYTAAQGVADEAGPFNTVHAQDTVSTAHVAVQFGVNDAIVREITFAEPINGLTALELAGLDVVTSATGFGTALCAIEGVGCPADDCFCGCPPPYFPCVTWQYLYWDDDAWTSYGVGVEGSSVEDGDVEGLAWGGFGTAPPPAPALVSAQEALDWLRDRQLADGSFGSLNDTAEVLMAVGANKLDGSTWDKGGPSLLANAISRGTEFAERNAAGVGKLATALAAQESYWPIDALRPLNYYDPVSGEYDSATLYHAWAMLGTASLSETVPVSATDALKDLQLEDGGWEWAAGFGSDTNNTAVALQALAAAGEPLTSTSVVSGLAFLASAQNDDGGFTYQPDSPYGTDSDTNSTAYVVQALLAVGEDPLSGRWVVTSSNPISYLVSMQLPDGSFEWQTGYGSNQYATQQAIPALLHRRFPITIKEVDVGYGVSGRAVSRIGGTESPLSGVIVEAEGAGDLFFATTDATGAYTISVPTADSYALTPFLEGFTFTPIVQAVEVGGMPGDVTSVPDFVGATRVYLPLILRH